VATVQKAATEQRIKATQRQEKSRRDIVAAGFRDFDAGISS
jgi:hypothetical protein